MKILLAAVNAKYIHSNPAVYSLRAYAAPWRDYTGIAEYTINQLPEQILADLYERQPDVIAFSCYIWNWAMIRGLLQELPKLLPRTALWLGGPEVSFDAPEILESFPRLSGIMIGEGEAAFCELCRHYITGEGELSEIAGLCLPETGFTGERALTPLDDIPFFYDDLDAFRNRIVYYESARGCPFRCSYCLSAIDKTVRLRSLDKVYQELDFFLAHKVPQVKFIDRTFNCRHDHCTAIWQYIKAHDNGVTNFHFEIAADLLTEEEITLLQSLRPGLVQLEIGVQTTNPSTLAAINRPVSTDHLSSVIARLRSGNNIHIHLDLIAGLPGEDLPSFRRSFDAVCRMGCEDLQLGFLKVLKGSPIQAQAREYGLQHLSRPPYEVLSTKWLSYGDLLELKRVERVLELYHNSGQYEATLRRLEQETDSPYALYLSLADFYREHGYEEKQPSRTEKIRILLNFACTRHPENEALYCELLTYDAYARENCMRRPDFAADLKPYKELFRTLKPHKEDHAEAFHYSVWSSGPLTRRDRPYFVIFDYEHKNPLNHNAAITVLEEILK